MNYQLGLVSLAPFLFGYARSIIFLRREKKEKSIIYRYYIYNVPSSPLVHLVQNVNL